MNYLLKRILVGVCVALVMMFVHKLSHASNASYNSFNSSSGNYFSTPTAACSSMGFGLGAGPTYGASGLRAFYMCSNNYDATSGAAYCPYGGQPTYGVNGGPAQCADPACPPGQVSGIQWGEACIVPGRDGCYTANHGDTTPPGFQCVPDCKSSQQENSTGQCIPKKLCAPYEVLSADGFCRADTSPTVPKQPLLPPHAPNSPPNDDGSCPSGTANVGTDSTGTAICRGTGTAPSTGNTTTAPTKTTTNPDGSTTTTDANTKTNSDGSITSNTTTCNIDFFGEKSCSVTSSTGTKADGTPGKSDGNGDGIGGPKGTCEIHPELNQCQNSGVTGGCSAGVDTTACTGDAISCAILRQQKKEYCENTKPNPMTDLGLQILGGGDPLQSKIDLAMKGDTVDLTTNHLDTSGFLGGGSGFRDQTVDVMGHALVLPFSTINGVELRFP